MSLFASRRNTRTEEQVIVKELQELLGAVEVTGLNAWERAAKVYRREARSFSDVAARAGDKAALPGSRAGTRPAKQDPLFPDMEDAA